MSRELAEKLPNALFERRAALENIAFPEHEDAPSHGFQQFDIPPIALDIADQLGRPVAKIGLGCPPILARRLGMLVPEAAMDEDDFLPWPEDQIRLAGQVLGMEPVAITHAVHQRPHQHLRLHPRRPDSSHVPGAEFFP